MHGKKMHAFTLSKFYKVKWGVAYDSLIKKRLGYAYEGIIFFIT